MKTHEARMGWGGPKFLLNGRSTKHDKHKNKCTWPVWPLGWYSSVRVLAWHLVFIAITGGTAEREISPSLFSQLSKSQVFSLFVCANSEPVRTLRCTML